MLSTNKKDDSEDEKKTLDATGFFTKRDAIEEGLIKNPTKPAPAAKASKD